MIVVANSGLINFKKTGTIRTRGVLSKKGEKKALDFFLVLLPKSQLYYFYRYLISVLSIVPQWNSSRLSFFGLIGNLISE